MVQAVFTGDLFDLRNESGPDAASDRTRCHVARPQFRVADHDGADTDRLTLDFSHQPYFAIAVGEESFDDLISDWPRPCLDD